MRRCRGRLFHRGSVLLSKQEDLCSTSHVGSGSRRIGFLPIPSPGTPAGINASRVPDHYHRRPPSFGITLRGRNFLLYELSLFEGRTSCSASYYSPSRETSALRVKSFLVGRYEILLRPAHPGHSVCRSERTFQSAVTRRAGSSSLEE